MNKKIALGLVGVMVMAGLTGCGSKNAYLMDITYSKYVKLCDYKNVEATKVIYDVTEDEIQDAIDEDMYEYVTYDEVTDRAAQEGDYANVTYTATIDGTEDENYSGEEEDIMIGEGYIFPEVEEALVGMNTGESKQVDATITEDYAYEDEDAGKKVTVDVTLNEISVENTPEYNDDFVKENTDYDSTADYEKAKKEELLKSKEDDYKYAAIQEIMQYLLDNSTFNGYPEDLYTQCEENYNNENEYSASMYGMELDEFEEMLGLDEETKKQDIETSVNSELIIGAIAQAEGITCSKKEIQQYAKDNYEDYGYDSADEFLKDYSDDEVGYQITYEKVTDFLYDHAKFTEMSEEDYNAQQEALYNDSEDAGDSEDETVTEDIEVEDDTESEATEGEDTQDTESVEEPDTSEE